MSSSHLVFFYLLLSSMLTSTLLANEITDDHLALLAFKNGITSGALSSWNESVHFCNWTGVSCSRKHPERVTALDLSMSGLGGFISPSIANLSFIQRINLSLNGFFGKVPPEFGLLHRLHYLNLSFNTLHGMVPVSLANCSKLRVLDLGCNKFMTGSIPVELGQTLPKLEKLVLANNSLTGVIPSSIGNLTSLILLSFARNNLQGIIPEELGRLSNLIRFQVAGNWLNGSIPLVLFNISSLDYFCVGGNQLHGTLPTSLGAKLPKLTTLLLGGNKLSGTIPASLSNASMLQMIDLATNKLSGTVPPVFGGMNDLFSLNLEENQFQASDAKDLSFIDSLVNCSNLQIFAIAINDLGGVLPLSLANFSKELRFLSMDGNHFSGIIPHGIENLISLNTMHFTGNDLTGQIPEHIGNIPMLLRLGFGDNMLTGYIPSSIGNLTQLEDLDISWNKFEGTIPSTMKKLHHLTTLYLSDNSFSGRIPGEIFSQLLSLRVLDLGNNYFNGNIPSEIGGLINLQQLLLNGNELSGEIPVSISGCAVLEDLQFQGNLFTGSIPSSLGNLRGISYLNLSDNKLSGGIPSSFKNLKVLEVLSLSNNNLSGSIPEFLEDFQFLSVLDLSYNHFHGELPVKGVFGNSSAMLSVVGNGELCGGVPQLHLPVCLSISPHKRSRGSFVMKIVIPIASFLFCLFLVLYFVFTRWKQESRMERQTTSFPVSYENFPRVSYNDLVRATDGFSSINLIGKGRHGSVYKGTLNRSSSTMLVAIKVFNLNIRGASKSFMSECESLRSIKHRNLIKIITSCVSVDSEGNDFKALVLDFMPNGSFDSWLHPEQERQQQRGPLSLLQRLNVATDVADAMEYLHHSCQPPVVHCDLKPSNVLLDDDMNAHVGDFGLAKFLMNSSNNNNSMESSTTSTGIKGTIGYVPPEYGLGSEVSTTGDVYSYGILVLELFTGKRPVDERFKDGMTMRKLVEICASHDSIMEVIDPSVFSQEDDDIEHGDISVRKKIECLVSVVALGLACSVESPNERLGMTDVAAQMHAIRKRY